MSEYKSIYSSLTEFYVLEGIPVGYITDNTQLSVRSISIESEFIFQIVMTNH